MILRKPYNYDTNKATLESGLECKDKSKTQQNQKEQADINHIVKRFGLTGQLPTNLKAPVYGDFTAVSDYHTALNAVKAADNAFNKMPAAIRTRFNNNPQEFVEFCSDEKNRKEAESLGLVLPKEPAETEPAVPVTASAVNKVEPAKA